MTTLGVLAMVIHLRTFNNNRCLMLREVSSGVKLAPMYIAQVRMLAW